MAASESTPSATPGRTGVNGAGDDTAGTPGRGEDDDRRAVLAAVSEAVLRLTTGAGDRPARVRAQAGDVVVEVTWPDEPRAGAATPAAPAREAPGPDGAAVPARGPAAADGTDGAGSGGGHQVRSPIVGRFYRGPEPGAPPYTDVGEVVSVGQQLAVVETMKVMIPVPADVAGTVVEVLRADGDDVEHGQPLFRIAPG